jgi:NADPH:quinone reductase-like Zn-dependent oxidoreductase
MATTTPAPSTTTNTTMKSILVHEFVSDLEQSNTTAITFSTDTEIPSLLKKDEMLIRVLACSISPGDILMVGGNLILMHPGKFPFIPGMDVCGVVEDPNNSNDNDLPDFQKGDIVVAARGMTPVGGMAEYMSISKKEAALKPPSVSVNEAAASSSAITARNAVLDYCKPGDRVLILGGSGGVGSAAIQMAKKVMLQEDNGQGQDETGGSPSPSSYCSFVATTSTQTEFCKALGADVVMDYRTENWWEKKWEHKFDKIIDTVGGGNFVDKAHLVLKPGNQGGQFIAVTGDDPKPDMSTWWKTIRFFANLPLRPLHTWIHAKTLPAYILLMPYDIPQGRKQVLDWMEKKSLQIKLDEQSPLPFTQEGVQKAFAIVASGHAHGKVVVQLAEK